MKKKRSKMPIIIPNQDAYQRQGLFGIKNVKQFEEQKRNTHYQKELAKRRTNDG